MPTDAASSTTLPRVAGLDGGRAAIVDDVGREIIVVEPNGYQSRVPLLVDPAPFIVSGEHDMIYGIAQQPTDQNAAGAIAVAIPLTGPNAGRAVATEPVGIVAYTEVAVTILGHGQHGIINRDTGDQVIAYRDTTGGPRDSTTTPPNYQLDDTGTVRDSDGTAKWTLSIERAPDYPGPGSYVTAPPAQIGDGRAVYWTTIGSPADPTHDNPTATLPVIAVLNPDGTGTWYSVPDGWQVASSDEQGVVFVRRVGTTIQVATLPPADQITSHTGPTNASTGTVTIPTGSYTVGPNDVIARHDDGDLYLHPGLLDPTSPPASAIRIVDEGDPRTPVTEGDGPNQVNQVAGEHAGVIYYTDCCEPIAGNLKAASGPATPPALIGYGSSPALSPNGRYLATASNFGIAVIDLASGLITSAPLDATDSQTNVWDLQWSNDQQDLVVLEFDATGYRLATYNATTLNPTATAPIVVTPAPASTQDIHFAGQGPNGAIVIAVTTSDATDLHAYDPATLHELTDEQRMLPAGATSVRLGPDGRSVMYIIDSTLDYQPAGAAAAKPITTGVTAAWFGRTSTAAPDANSTPAVPSTAAPASRCAASDLTAVAEPLGDSAMNNTQLVIDVTNTSDRACTLPTAPPTLTGVAADGTQTPLHSWTHGTYFGEPTPLTGPLPPGATAVVWVGGANPSMCDPVDATQTWNSILLQLPDGGTLSFTTRFDTKCGSNVTNFGTP